MSERIIATNGLTTLVGRVLTTREWGGSNLVTIELEGTTSSVEVDDADFTWYSAETENFPLKEGKQFDLRQTQVLRKVDLAHDSESIEPYVEPEPVKEVHEANTICSDVVQFTPNFFGSPVNNPGWWDSTNQHKLVLDIDVPAVLLPSSRPGHHHLFIDKAMNKEEWLAVIIALRNAGILEDGYVGASIERGYTAVRLPWIQKESGSDAMVG